MRNATCLNNKVSNEIKSNTDIFKLILEIIKIVYILEMKIQNNNKSKLHVNLMSLKSLFV